MLVTETLADKWTIYVGNLHVCYYVLASAYDVVVYFEE